MCAILQLVSAPLNRLLLKLKWDGDMGRGTWDVGRGTWGRGDAGNWGRGDTGTWGRGDSGTWYARTSELRDARGCEDVINK